MYTCSLAEPATRAPSADAHTASTAWSPVGRQLAPRERVAARTGRGGDGPPPAPGRRRRATGSRSSRSRPSRCRARRRRRRRRREADDLHRADGDGLGLRPDDDGGVVGQPGEQVGRAVEHLLEPPVGGGEELADGCAGVLVEQPGGGEMVDEEAVALVRRDAPGRGVRLDEVALLLEHSHLVAHGRRRDARSRARRRCGSSPPGAPWRCTPAPPHSRSLSSARPAWCLRQVIDGVPPAGCHSSGGILRAGLSVGRQVADVLIPLGMGEVAAGELTGTVDPVLRVEVPDDDSLSRVDGGLHPIGS